VVEHLHQHSAGLHPSSEEPEPELPEPSESLNWSEEMIVPEDVGDDEPSQRPTEQTLVSLLDYLVKQRDDHLPWWSPQEPLLEDLEAVFQALGIDRTGGVQLVLEQMITVETTLTADNTDFLAGTQLDQPGVPGAYTIWGASTVGDTEISITLGGRTVVNAAVLVLRANSEIRENEDTFFQVISRTGGRPVVNINVITAATVRIRVKFIPAFAT
jgi:hypothetical protein